MFRTHLAELTQEDMFLLARSNAAESKCGEHGNVGQMSLVGYFDVGTSRAKWEQVFPTCRAQPRWGDVSVLPSSMEHMC